MHATTIEAIAAFVTVLATVLAVGRWTGRVDQLAKAIDKLTAVFEKMDSRLDDHEHRITVVETKIKDL